jgi:hypothetical protein
MYAKSPQGLSMVTGDPTATPRWLFVMAGGLVFGGLWAQMHSLMKHISDNVKAALARSGGIMAGLGGAIQLACAAWVMSSQPDYVRQGIQGSSLFTISGYLFVAGAVVAAGLGTWQGLKGRAGFLPSLLGSVFGFVANAGAVIVRDGIRDITLFHKGFDVWNRSEASNWSVIGLFLLLFVIMLGVVYWLLKVMSQAKAPEEQVSL